jgi:hypothetical protein
MQELTGDLWTYLGKGMIAITTNGYVTWDGRAMLGQGVARQAGERFPNLALRLGQVIREGGNHVLELGDGLVSFPVEDSPWSLPDLRLIRRSAEELRALADERGWSLVIVPRPGCGGGGLDWGEVAPVLRGHFDERFVVITSGPVPRTPRELDHDQNPTV